MFLVVLGEFIFAGVASGLTAKLVDMSPLSRPGLLVRSKFMGTLP